MSAPSGRSKRRPTPEAASATPARVQRQERQQIARLLEGEAGVLAVGDAEKADRDEQAAGDGGVGQQLRPAPAQHARAGCQSAAREQDEQDRETPGRAL